MKKIFVVLFFVFLSSNIFAETEKRYSVSIDNSPSYGNSNAPVTIIEFIDYQ
ncbi:MAG: hypothetical protein HQL10_00235 [Nitrospirae bacterium]|nr:hypothetical protein [Nitrospirota bacterium]